MDLLIIILIILFFAGGLWVTPMFWLLLAFVAIFALIHFIPRGR